LPARDIPIGRGSLLGNVATDLSKLNAPGEYKLVVGLKGTDIENDWNFWVYPTEIDLAPKGDVFITGDWNAAKQKLSDGGEVLFTPPANALDNTSPPLNNVPVFWNRLMNPKLESMMGLWCDAEHPALAGFPTEDF